jgi:hypothetical protein
MMAKLKQRIINLSKYKISAIPLKLDSLSMAKYINLFYSTRGLRISGWKLSDIES